MAKLGPDNNFYIYIYIYTYTHTSVMVGLCCILQEKQRTDFRKTCLQNKFLMTRSKLSGCTSFCRVSACFELNGAGRPRLPCKSKTLQKQAFPGKWAKFGFGQNTVFSSSSTEYGAPTLQKKTLTESNSTHLYIYICVYIHIHIYIYTSTRGQFLVENLNISPIVSLKLAKRSPH